MKQISQRLDSFTSSHSADYNDDAAGDMKYFLNHFSKLFHCREWIQVWGRVSHSSSRGQPSSTSQHWSQEREATQRRHSEQAQQVVQCLSGKLRFILTSKLNLLFQTDFETRKSFIEHCQVVHGMKFKTKSGMSIPPPSSSSVSSVSSSPAPVTGVKRKMSDHGNE